MLCWQSGYVLGYSSLAATQKLRAEYWNYWNGVEDIVVAMDNDGPGQRASKYICQASPIFKKANMFKLGNDLGEHINNGGDIIEWISTELKALTKYQTSDLEK